ncbi:MAG: transcriptional regulator [Pseudomonadales bacterium]|nr:transcriptional regulator [Pseudomonadales bacterium]
MSNPREEKVSKRETTLSMALTDQKSASKATPMDAFLLAKKYWLNCQRLNLGSMAEELGVSRATLFRWIGNKDLLMGEIIWSVYKPTVLYARQECKSQGVDYVVDVFREVNIQILNSKPLRHFLVSDGQYALSIISSKNSTFHSRMVELNTELLQQEVDRGAIKPYMSIDSMSYFMVRIGESCTFSEVILDQEPDLDQLEDACKAVRILLGGKPQVEV